MVSLKLISVFNAPNLKTLRTALSEPPIAKELLVLRMKRPLKVLKLFSSISSPSFTCFETSYFI